MQVTCSFSSAWKSGLESWWVMGLGLNRHIRAQRVNIKLSTAHTHTHKHTHTHTRKRCSATVLFSSLITQLRVHALFLYTYEFTHLFCTCMHHSMSILHTKMCACMQVFYSAKNRRLAPLPLLRWVSLFLFLSGVSCSTSPMCRKTGSDNVTVGTFLYLILQSLFHTPCVRVACFHHCRSW